MDAKATDAPDRGEWTSSGLMGLVVRGLRQRRPDLLPTGIEAPNQVQDAHASSSEKRNLLVAAYDAGGARLVLDISGDIQAAGYDPIVQVLLRSADPLVFAQKWQRFERYNHSHNRLVLEPDGERGFRTFRHSLSEEPPHPAENCLILGVVAHLLAALGAQRVSLQDLSDPDMPEWLIRKGDVVAPGNATAGGGVRCRLSWDAFETGHGDGDLETQTSRYFGGDQQAPATAWLRDLFSRDVSRNWSWAELAAASGRPVRSLQRVLRNEGTSMTLLVRAVRIREACHLLEAGDLTLTQIGYWCGFSDSAHFSREFRKSIGMPPSVYREVSVQSRPD